MTAKPDSQTQARPEKNAFLFLLIILAAGLIIRFSLAASLIETNRVWDHHDYVSWAVLMEASDSFASLYDEEAKGALCFSTRDNQVSFKPTTEKRICNYPPGAGYILALQGKILQLFDENMISNTLQARICFALGAILADIILALGCFVLVRSLSNHAMGIIASALVFLTPPLMLDSSWWGQTDSWILAPAIWMLWAMIQKRWILAGVLWGVALSLKTQGILLAPVWLFAFIIDRQRLRIAIGGIAAILTLLVLAAPFMLKSGLSWYHAAYGGNLLKIYKLTTMSAFNIWYVDLLICENHDASVLLAGLEKDLWGKILFAGGFLICSTLLWRYRRRDPDVLLRFVGITLLLAVMIPTRVHERYIVLPLPFLICAAMVHRKILWGVIPLIVVASFQITSSTWIAISAARWSQTENRHRLVLEYQYSEIQKQYSPEEFAVLNLPPPEKALEEKRKELDEKRRQTNDPMQEWTLTIFALLSTAACLVTTIPGRKPSGDAVESSQPVVEA